jgi:hypothetical protein
VEVVGKWRKVKAEGLAVSINHLVGKRTGRPPGSKSKPWRRDLAWVLRNLDNEDAVPPSPLAARLLALAKDHPDRLVCCLMQLDAQGRPDGVSVATQHQPHDGNGQGGGPTLPPGKVEAAPGRVKRFFVPWARLVECMRGVAEVAVKDLDDGLELVGAEADVAHRGVWLTVRSGVFPEVPAGEPVPEFDPGWMSKRYLNR